MSLLEDAKKVVTIRKYSFKVNGISISEEEQIEFALEWLKGNVKMKQLAKISRKHTTTMYILLATRLKLAYRKGLIKID
jgi:hypothetical protein